MFKEQQEDSVANVEEAGRRLEVKVAVIDRIQFMWGLRHQVSSLGVGILIGNLQPKDLQ